MTAQDRRGLILVAVTALVLALAFCARIDDWLFKNETFNNLAMGLDVAAEHPSLVALRDAAVANCTASGAENPGDCARYQTVITQNFYFGEAIQSVFGWQLAQGIGQGPWLPEVHSAVVWALLASCAVMVALWLALTVTLPAAERLLLSAVTLAMVLLGYFRDDPTLVLPDPFAAGAQAWEGPVLVALAVAVLFALPKVRGPLLARTGQIMAFATAKRSRPWLLIGGLVLVQAVLPPPATAAVQVACLGLIALLLVHFLQQRSLEPGLLLATACLLFILISGDRSVLPRKFEIPHNQVFLVFGAYLAYATARPRGALVWALPLIGVFHFSVVMLLSLALALAEGIICLRRRRISRLLVAAVLTFGIGFALTRLFEGDLAGVTPEAVVDVAAMMLAAPWRLASLLAVLALVAALTLRPLLASNPKDDDLARAGLLVLQALGASTVAHVINGVDPAFASTPGYFMFATLPDYLNRGVTFGVVLVLALLLFRRPEAETASKETTEPEAARAWRLAGSILALIAVIGVAKVDLSLRSLVYVAGRNLAVHVALQDMDPEWCRTLPAGAKHDDHYLLSADNPLNGAEIYFSVLKLKARIVAGLHDPAQMTIGLPPAHAGDCGP